MEAYTAISYEKREGTATITKINRDTGYSMSRDVVVQMRRALLDAAEDDAVQVIVITSESGIHQGAYAVNQGMEQEGGNEPLHIRELIRYGHAVARLIETMEKPVIGVIGRQAIAGWGGCQRVSRITNWRRAKKFLMLGLPVSGREAEEIGLVTEAVPADALADTVQRYIKRLKEVAPHSVALTKAAMRRVWEEGHSSGLAYEQELSALLLSEGRFKAMTDAVMAGRKPEIAPYTHLTYGPEWR